MSAPKRGLTTAQSFLLDQACRPVRRAFGSGPYLVGTAAAGPNYRDVDVRTILADDDFDALFADRERLWDLLCMSVSLYLSKATGLPVDFQVQRMTEANVKYDGPRHALGINASPADRFAGGGDATPEPVRAVSQTSTEVDAPPEERAPEVSAHSAELANGSTCGFCGKPVDVWPSKDCEEPQEHTTAVYDCDCGDVVTIADAIASPKQHRRCHLIGTGE